jgi:hypothetical protein
MSAVLVRLSEKTAAFGDVVEDLHDRQKAVMARLLNQIA